MPEDPKLDQVVAVMHGLAHPARLRLLVLLAQDGPQSGTQLADRLGASLSLTTYYLLQLEGAGLLKSQSKNRQRVYALADPSLGELIRVILG